MVGWYKNFGIMAWEVKIQKVFIPFSISTIKIA